jgi:peptidoglycan hydrolase-like protein with peptidoglycan-binding domain
MVGRESERGSRRVRAAVVAALVVCGLLGAASSGQAQSPRPQAGSIDAADLDGMLNVPEKKLLQEGLIWLGYYNGWADGVLARGTRDAIWSWQEQNGIRPTGRLDGEQALRLAGSAFSARDRFGWQPLSDSRSRITLSYPSKLLTEQKNSDMGGLLLDSQDGNVSLMTVRMTDIKVGQIDALYEALAGDQKSKVTYEFRRDDLFILSGNRGSGKFYARYEQRGGEIRGYDLIWDAAHDKEMGPVSVMVSNSFYPFGYDTPQEDPSYPTLQALLDAKEQAGGAGQGGGGTSGGGTEPPPQRTSASGNPKGGTPFSYEYQEPKSKEMQPAYQFVQDTDLIRQIPEIRTMDGMFNMPRPLAFVAGECGTVNAFYSPKESMIALCYEMVDSLVREGHALAKQTGGGSDFQTDYVKQNIRFILLHETGHALIDILGLPSTGREEDAVDQLAAVTMMLNNWDNEATDEVIASLKLVALWFSVNGSGGGSNQDADMARYADEHSLSEQRYFNLLCMMYGRDPDRYAQIVQDGLLPEARAGRCRTETVKIFEAWSTLLIPHFASSAKSDGAGAGTAGTAAQPQEEPEEDPYGTLKR